MALKTYRPTSPGIRHLVMVDRSMLYKGAPVKILVEGKRKTGGRNAHGRITTRHIGGGHKQSYRMVDFRRGKHDIAAVVERLEYDPNRSAFIALIKYADGHLSYILAPQRLAVGDSVVSGQKVDVKPGNAMPLASIPIGTIVHNVELKPGRGGQMARSAGAFVQLVGRDSGWAVVKLMSGETRKVRGRSPQRWSYQGRQALGNALGQADQGLQDTQEQEHGQVHYSQPLEVIRSNSVGNSRAQGMGQPLPYSS
jgi:large subunit ribosomal protein L2